MNVYVIAEAGVNHNGNIEIAKQLIDEAKEAGADAIKFQSFKAENLVVQNAPKAEYQLRFTNKDENQFSMLKKLELSVQDHFILKDYAASKKIDFLSTPFDKQSLDLLIDELNIKTIKVSSGDLTNAPLLYDISLKTEHVILSTGMSTLSEIESALGVLAFGFIHGSNLFPSLDGFEAAYSSEEGQLLLKNRVSILHCTTEYPAPVDEINLNVLDTLKNAFGLSIGYSDHTVGTHVPIAAVAKGARIIEKHFTLDKNMEGPDHQSSLEPHELKYMIKCIREIELSLGDGVKRVTKTEWKNRSIARKSLVAAEDIQVGQPLNILCKRPGDGVSPYLYWDKKNTLSTKEYFKDELIES